MNPYSMLGSGDGAGVAASLSARLASWHDAMVAHERRLRAGRGADVCDEECPHADARILWVEALAVFGERAHELTFLRSRAAAQSGSSDELVAPTAVVSEAAESSRRSNEPARQSTAHRPKSSARSSERSLIATAQL
jgi:hypothetical protein